jgi:hypothetical protein
MKSVFKNDIVIVILTGLIGSCHGGWNNIIPFCIRCNQYATDAVVFFSSQIYAERYATRLCE